MMVSFTKKEYPPCRIYDCANCPYLDYPFCTYNEEEDGSTETKENFDLWVNKSTLKLKEVCIKNEV